MNPTWKKRLLPPAIVLGCGIIAGGLIALGGAAEKTPTETAPTLVQLWEATPQTGYAHVRGTGVVQPARAVSVIPQVRGRIVFVSPNFVPGGRLAEGEVYARIESRDYRAAHAQAKSLLRLAELELELERNRGTVAAREWQMLNRDTPEQAASDLALRTPHLSVATTKLEAARSALGQATANLERTTLRAPFNAIVLSEQIDVGQVVGSTPIAKLVGTDTLWVSVSVPVSKLRDLGITTAGPPNSTATVWQRLGNDEPVRYPARVLHLGGQLDPQTRHAQLFVAVDQPFDVRPNSVPLLPGAYVEVDIQGRPLHNVFQVPRSALSNGDRLWVSEDGKLAARKITIESGDDENVLVSGQVSAGDAIIISPIPLPIPGMPVQAVQP